MAHLSQLKHPKSTLDDQFFQFKLGDHEYAALPGIKPPADERIPLRAGRRFVNVVLTDPWSPWTKTSFIRHLIRQANEDDVWHPEFNEVLIFWATSMGHIQLPRQLLDYLKSAAINFIIVEQRSSASTATRPGNGCSSRSIPGGPYVWLGEWLLPIYRLYADERRTCVETLFQKEGENEPCPIRIRDNETSPVPRLLIPVPSRWQHKQVYGSSASLHGKRALLKDIFDVRGLRISACNRAYLQISRLASRTSPMIQELIDVGVLFVGKAKLSSLISREEPSESIFVEFPVPENPRGDFMQSPAGSSSGSAAAVAAYDWLDFALGSDSTGSARRPAMVNGCFAIRLSTDVLPSQGMMPCFPLFDSPAVFARDLGEIHNVISCWCSRQLDPPIKVPTSVTIFTEYHVHNRQQSQLFEDFAQQFASSFQLVIRRASLRREWARSPPDRGCESDLLTFLNDVGRLAFYFDFTESTKDFRAEYEQKHHVRPAANRTTTWRWEQAQKIKPEQRDEAVRRLKIYKEWLLTNVLNDPSPIVILPIMEAAPNYRDEQSCSPIEAPDAWDQLWLSPILGAPEVTVPIGQIPFKSRMTDREEMLPVAASVMGLPGTDAALVATVAEMLERSKRPSRVATGRQMFYEDWEIIERN